jgi:predicted transcriptional regulator
VKLGNKSYVYIYLDLLKPGRYDYGVVTFLFEPFYVGAGRGKRDSSHLREAQTVNSSQKGNRHKLSRIRKTEVGILRIREGLSRKRAFDVEKFFIALIGRRSYNFGPLTNLTDGGEGAVGYIWSEEKRKKQSQRMKALPHFGPKGVGSVNPLSEKTLLRLREMGFSNSQIAEKLNCSPGLVWRFFKEKLTHAPAYQHIPYQLIEVSSEEMEDLLKRFREGETVTNLCRDFNLSEPTLRRKLKKYSTNKYQEALRFRSKNRGWEAANRWKP